MIDWSAWQIDTFTIGWIVWVLFFFVWEAIGISQGVEHTLTWHLRPVFHLAPPVWYMALAAWLWLGPHFFFPRLEESLAKLVGG